MFVFPHGATVDRDGNLWVTDARGENGKGHQVFKFSPDGKVLMTLGKAGVSGSGPDLFDQPTDVVGRAERRHLRHRQPPQRQEQPRRPVHEGRQRSSRNGARKDRAAASSASRTRSRWIRAAVCSSAIARTTASRSSIRTARYIAEWRQFGRPSGIAITQGRHDLRRRLGVGPRHRRARTARASGKGSASAARRTARVTAFIEDMEPTAPDHSGAEGVGVDAQGNVYGGVVRRQMLERHVKR